MAPAFPIELCYSIIQNVNAVADLLVLSLCCSEFRKEAQRLLFRHPVTSTHEELMLFILAICSDSSRFGPLVHTFTMEYNPGPNANVSQDTAFIAYALSSMYNLMQVEHYASLLLPPKIYTNCKASSESFNYYGDSKTTLDISSLVYDVLPTQASLTHIIMDFTGTVRISPKLMKAAANLCPNLISLSVKSSVIGKMLLQRKKHLQSLQWLAGTSTPIGMTVLQYNHLSYLMLLTLARGLDTSFAQHLSSLALLEICFNPGWDTDILLSEIQFIAQIPQLHYLMLHIGIPAIPQSLEDGQQMECPEVARGAFRLRNTLKHIDVGSIRERPSAYLRIFAPLNEYDTPQSHIISGKEIDAFRIKYSSR